MMVAEPKFDEDGEHWEGEVSYNEDLYCLRAFRKPSRKVFYAS
ncbi:unnamed protein product [Larinioides sclopetarius]|uniref:Uncharacterized protein n=1 Tax=Larinioides sclopetarius TaxID=280406 RepID=A0AAV2B464_9ARAC